MTGRFNVGVYKTGTGTASIAEIEARLGTRWAGSAVNGISALPELETALGSSPLDFLIIVGFTTSTEEWESAMEAVGLSKALCPRMPVIAVGEGIDEWRYASAHEIGLDEFISFGELWRLVPVTERLLGLNSENEERTRKSRQADWLTTVVDEAAEAIFTCSSGEKITFWNHGAEHVFGWSACEAVGRSLTDIFGSAPVPLFFSALTSTIRGVPWTGEVQLPHQGGRILDLKVRVSRNPSVGAAGDSFFLFSATDVTEQRRAQRDLEERNRVFSAITSQAREAMVVIDPDSGRFVEFNDAVTTLLGYPRDEFARMTLADVQAVFTATEIQERFRRTLVSGLVVFDTKHRHKDGRILDVHISSRPVVLGEKRYLVAVWSALSESDSPDDGTRSLETQRMLLKAMVAQTHDAMAVIDVESGEFIEFNDSAALMLGYSPDEFARLHSGQVREQDPGTTLSDRFHALQANGGVEYDSQLWSKSGERVDVHIASRAVVIGRKAFIVAAWHRRLTPGPGEVSPDPVAEKLRLFTEAAQDVFWTYDLQSDRFQYISPGFDQLFGPGSIAATTNREAFIARISTEDQLLVKNAWKARTAGVFRDLEYRVPTPDGSVRWVQERALPVGGASGYSVAARLIDISHQREMELQLATFSDGLSFAIDGTNDGLWDWPDVGQDAQWWSPKYFQLLGYCDGEIHPGVATFAKIIHPDDHSKAFFLSGAAIEANTLFEMKMRLRVKSGEYRWFYSRAKVFRRPEGVVRMAGSIQDIEDRVQAELSLKETSRKLDLANEELRTAAQRADALAAMAQSANRAAADFLQAFIHGLEAPMHRLAMALESSVPASVPMDPEKTRTVASGSLDEIQGLLGKVAAFSALDAFQPSQSRFRLDECLRAALGRLQVAGEISFAMDGDASGGMEVFADPECVARVIGLLVEINGKSGEGGELHFSIAGAGPTHLRVSIPHPGIKIRPACSKSFLDSSFACTDGEISRRVVVGLNLAMCKRLVELMNGELGLSDSASEVPIIWFTVPRPPQKRVPPPATTPRRTRVLVVEDNMANQLLIRFVLEKLSCQVDLAADGDEGVRLFRPGVYDLIFMDSFMPKIDGPEAARAIRATSSKPPIVAVSADDGPENRRKCLEAGMDDFIAKPVTLAKLKSVIEKWSVRGPQEMPHA
jgi:PAS domain S-box-containing protein